jgi:hypothetical protein
MKNIHKINENIYITSDEKPKSGDWSLYAGCKLHKCIEDIIGDEFKKIILTTDQDLIKDGVQVIDDEFLEWFVKNPSCEEVEVTYGVLKPFESENKGYLIHCPDNEPLEEPKQENCCTPIGQIKRYVDCKGCDRKPKQETLEEPTMIDDWLNEYGDPEIYKKVERDLELREAAEKYSLELLEAKTIQHHEKTWIKSMFIHIAEWQQERSYSEAIKFGKWLDENMQQREYYPMSAMTMEELFKQFKT